MVNDRKSIKLGSLFDGSGGFPLAADMCGIIPAWASEIEKFPVEVTTKRFPKMKHLGDVTKVKGDEIEPVDIITFGSPCQDLSVAGKQTGLSGDRSSLFYEAVRIIKEMRDKTNGIYPTFAVWENVPGAFSSNRGEDFRVVLEMLCKIKGGETVNVPRPEKGKWNTYGCIMGDDYSIAWRVLDAQFWGVPQRRRRVFIVADLRGQRAAEILFKRDGLQRDFAESRKAWEGAAAAAQSSVGVPMYTGGFKGQNSVTAAGLSYCDNQSPTLSAKQQVNCLAYSCGNGQACNSVISDVMQTLSCMHDQQAVLCYDARGNGDGETAPTITGDHNNRITDYTALIAENKAFGFKGRQGAKAGNIGYRQYQSPTLCAEQMPHCLCIAGNTIDRKPQNGGNGAGYQDDIAYTLNTMDRHAVVAPEIYSLDRAAFNQGENAKYDFSVEKDKVQTLVSKGPSEVADIEKWIVRRLTPLECCRLQGFPDWWCADISHKDAPEYKMWGNGVALPCVLYIMEGLAGELKIKEVSPDDKA